MSAFRRVTSSLASAIALAGLAVGVAAQGEVLTSNLSDLADGGSFVRSTFPQRAQAFSTTATGTQISAVKLDIASSTATQPFSIKLYSTSTGTSGLPDTALTTLFSGTGGDINPLASPFTISGLNLSLAPSTAYFVVMEFGGGSFSGQWNYNFETTGSGAGFLPNNATSESSLGNWQPVSGLQPYRMEIVVVPEPPAIVLSGIGLASAMIVLRRRRS